MGFTDYLGKKKKQAEDTFSSLGATARSYADSLSKKASDYFQPTSEVRTRDFIREIPKATYDTVKPMFQGTYNVATKVPKIFGEKLAYEFNPNVRDQYEKGNLDILPTVSKTTPSSMLADTGRSMLEVATAGKGPKWATAPSVVKRTAFGAGTGYGFDVLGKVADEGKVTKESFKPGAGTVLGGVFGAAAKPTTEIVKEGVEQLQRGVNSGKKIVSQVPQAVRNSVENRRNPVVEVMPEHWVPSRKVSIRSDEAGRPDVIPPAPNGERYAGGAKPAGIDPVTQSPRYVMQTEKLIPEQRVERPRTPTISDVVDQVKQALPEPSLGMSIKAVGTGPTNKNTRAINAVNARKNAKASAIVENMKRGEVKQPELPLIPKASVQAPVVPKAPVAETAIDRFSRELDAIPAPWGDKTPQSGLSPSIERDLKEMKAKGLDKKVMDNLFGEKPTGPFNKYQQAAFDKKQERIKAIKEIAEAPAVLRAMGYTKKEAEKIGVEEAKIIAELGKLGYPKGDAILRDVRSETAKRILENRVPYKTLKEYYTRKHELDTKILEGIDPKTLKDISPIQSGTRDVYRNFETVFGGGKYNDPTFQRIKKELLDPFDASKGEFIAEQKMQLGALDEHIVEGLGIQKGSKLSAAVQMFGEGKLTLEQVKEKFPADWQKIVKANDWFRNMYDNMLDETNLVREYFFPTHPLFPESTKVIPKRQNYYRHFQEMADGFKGLMNIFDTPANIDPSLAVSSEFTKPGSKWLSFAQKRKGDQTEYDAVGGFLDYIKANAYAKHIDPHIQRFRGVDAKMKSKLPKGEFFDDTRIGLVEELSKKMDPFEQVAEMKDVSKIKNFLIEKGLQDRDALKMAKDLADIKDVVGVNEYLGKNLSPEGFSEFKAKALAEESGNKLNNFLVFLDDFANDLAGKTNPADRWLQKRLGRPVFKAINWLNSRVKANVILGNTSSAVAQFFSIPNGIANAGVRNAVPAIGDSLVGMLKNDVPSSKSVFLKERYFNGYDRFDPGVIANTKRLAVWLTSLGDKVGTTFTWNAQYRKALAEGVADPAKYADDWTRRMVAGRGIGEVPIDQKSKLIQLVAPFQLEVANQWRVFGDWARNDPSKFALAKKLMEYSVAVWVMNRIAKEIRGSDVAFDPMEAMLDAYQSFQDEENKVKGSVLAGGRVIGELLSNIPGGSTAAAFYPEFGSKDVFGTNVDLPTREKLFGDKDPTRFGNGLLAGKAFLEPQYLLVPPFGGRQIKNTIDGVGTLMQGYAETSGGRVMTPVDPTIPNIMKGVLNGKNALDEVQNYREADANPLGEKQDEIFKILAPEERGSYYGGIMDNRAANKEKEALRDAVDPTEPKSLSYDIKKLTNGKIYVKSLDREFRNEKEADDAIVLDAFLGSDKKFMEHDGRFYYKNPNNESGYGSKTIAERNKDIAKSSANLEMDRAQANNDMQAWAAAADKKIKSIDAYLATLDPTIDQDDIDSLTLEKENLIDKAEKFIEQGGFKKGRKLEEKYRYPLVDKDLMGFTALSKASKNPIIVKRPPVLNRRRMRKVRKARK